MLRFILFLFSFGMSVIGFTYIIIYLNLMSMDYTFIEYLKFISTRFECLISIIGLIIVSIIILGRKDKNDIYIWYTFKFLW